MSVFGSKSDARTIKFTFPSATAIDAGDLLFNNSGTAAKASAQTDQLTEAANQRLFAKLFLGASMDKRLVGETGTATRTVETDFVKQYTCPTTTWAVGDLIGASENSGGDALENQQVEKVTDPEAAIGVCIEAGTSLTKVWGHFFSRYVPGGMDRGLTYVSYYFTGTPAATDQVFFVAPNPCRVVGIAEVHSVAAGGASALQVVKDTGTSAPGAGTDLLASTGFDLNATANTTQQGTLSSTASDLILAAGDRLAVDFAQAIQSSAGVCVTVALAPLTPG